MLSTIFFFLVLMFNFFSWSFKTNLLVVLCVFLMFNFPLIYEELSFFFVIDNMSFSLIFLTIWVTNLMVLSSYSVLSGGVSFNLFLFLILFLLSCLTFSFICSDALSFYFFFEASLLPTLLIILGWGYQPERLQASIYFLFYTLFGSLPLLMLFFVCFNLFGSFKFSLMTNISINGLFLVVFSVFILLAFFIKMPMYFVHLWLPKAHVEAPVAGSMILAGVLLKLGGYGICRVLPLLIGSLSLLNNFIVGISLVCMFFVGLICLRLNDLKALVAYSSVAHMGMILCGLMIFSMLGLTGGLMMMISHGLASSGLFCIVNMYYERISSRSLFLNKGLLSTIPTFGLFMFMLTSANMAAPPSINLVSEIFLMFSLMGFSLLMMLIFPLGSFLGAVFSVFLFSYSQHGKSFSLGLSWISNNFRENHVLMCHIIPINMLILKSVSFFIY